MDYFSEFPYPREWLDENDLMLCNSIHRWAEIDVIAKRLEHGESVDNLLAPAMRKLLAEMGLHGLLTGINSAPEASAQTMIVALEQIGRADVGVGFLLAVNYALQAALIKADKTILLSTIDSAGIGSMILFDYTPNPNQPTFYGLSPQVVAEKNNEGWTITGKKVRPQCLSGLTKYFGVLTLDREGTPNLFFVPSDAPDQVIGEPVKKSGLAASVLSLIDFNHTQVGTDSLVFTGLEAYRDLLVWYYLGSSAVASGAMLATWKILKDWVDTRTIKGKGQIFKENPLVASLLGDIGRWILHSRMSVFQLARMISLPTVYGGKGNAGLLAVATAIKSDVLQAAMNSMNAAMELMASAGYATEWNLERYWRDVKTMQTYLSPASIAQMDIARHVFDCQRI